MDVVVWLRSLGLGKYEAAFRENEIDETVLPGLTAEDLKDLGVGIVGHRRKLLDAIAVLRPLRHSQRVGAFETPLGRVPIDVEALRKIADLAAARNSFGLADFGDDRADKLADWLASRQPKLVTAAHWEAIDRFERAAGEPHGRPRVKLPTLEELLRVGHG